LGQSPTDDSLLKMLYLAMINITKKWAGRRQDWSVIYAQMAIFLGRPDKPPSLTLHFCSILLHTLHFTHNWGYTPATLMWRVYASLPENIPTIFLIASTVLTFFRFILRQF